MDFFHVINNISGISVSIMIHWVDLLLSFSGVGHLGSICLICAVGFIFTFRCIKFFLEAKR